MSELDTTVDEINEKDEDNVQTLPEQKDDADAQGTKGNDRGKEKEAPKELSEAEKLYNALSDPRSARPIIEALARQAGLIKGEEHTPAEKKAAKKAIREVFAEALGEDMGFLSEKLGPAIEKVLEHYDTENRSRFEELTRAKAEEETSNAIEKLYSEHEDAEKFEARIFELMDEIAPGKNTKPLAYMKRLYQIAKAEATETSAKEKIKAKLKNNSEDATSRLSSSSTRESSTTRTNTKALDLDEAIALAAKSIEK